MSASEWSRITEERDDAVYHLRKIIESIQLDLSYADVCLTVDSAKAWLDEEICDDE